MFCGPFRGPECWTTPAARLSRSSPASGVNFVGGFVGVVLIGLLATEVMTAGPRASSAVAASSRSASKCLPR